MSVICKSEKELGKSLKNNEDEIMVEGDLARKIIRIKAVGNGVWAACFISLTAAVIFYLATPAAGTTTGGPGGAASLVAGTVAAGGAAVALGTAVAPAIALGVTAGGVGILNTLRNKYEISEKDDNYIKLKRK